MMLWSRIRQLRHGNISAHQLWSMRSSESNLNSELLFSRTTCNSNYIHKSTCGLATLNQDQNHYDKRQRGSMFANYLGALAVGVTVIVKNDDRQTVTPSFNFNEDQQMLLRATQENNVIKLRKLIRDNVDVNKKHPYGWTPLMVAAINNNVEAVRILLEAKANPNVPDSYSTAFLVANEKDVYDIGRIHQTREDEFSTSLSTYTNFRGSTALHYAVLADNKEIMELLIKAGADASLQNADGSKAVDYATPKYKSLLVEAEKEYESVQQERLKEARRKYPLEKRLADSLIGQKDAIKIAASAIRRKENGWFDENHPLVMLFLGSSGIGKTELAKQIAKYIHGDSADSFIRFDMSEFQAKHEAAKFIGAPPGYVGHDDGGQLTNRLAKCPSAVVLFDEVDKAHPDVLATLLQLFDEGHLTDSKGCHIECKDAVFIMTANLANEEISQQALHCREACKDLAIQAPLDDETNLQLSREFKDKVIHPILKQHFKRDEFLGRINEIVYFLPFTDAELHEIITKQLNYWAKRAEDVHKMTLTWDKSVLDVLAGGYDIHYGARSLIYEVERKVVGKLAAAQEKGLVKISEKIHLTVDSNKEILLNKIDTESKMTPIPNAAYATTRIA